jgi:hypothetical protein
VSSCSVEFFFSFMLVQECFKERERERETATAIVVSFSTLNIFYRNYASKKCHRS